MYGLKVENIVKYHGDIKSLADNLGMVIEILNEHFAIMTLTAGERLAISERPQIEDIEEQKIISIADDTAIPPTGITFMEQELDGLTGDGVLIAILGLGIDFTQKDFINEDGTTRILSIWDQNLAGTPPPGFTFGHEYTKEQINAVLLNPADGNITKRNQVGHGTTSAGAAAENNGPAGEYYTDIVPGASLLIVRLAGMFNTQFTSDTNLMRGIKYATDKAAMLNMPLIIHISLGKNMGEPDGGSLFEQYIEAVAGSENTAVVISAAHEGTGGKLRNGAMNRNDVPNYTRHFRGQEIMAVQETAVPSYMDIPNLITSADFPLEINPATSEAYLNYLVQYDFNTIQVIARHPEILVSSILQDFYAVVHIPYNIVQEVTAYVEVYSILERSRMFGLLANPALDAAGITAVKQPNLNLTGRGVLVGVVDTGIDYNLDTFKYENGQSKIIRIWDQSIESSDINNIPEGFIYGTEYTMEQINQAIASDNPEAVVPTRDEIGHGTFLASLIAGRRTAVNEEGAAPDAEIVVVKLKQAKQVSRYYSAITSRDINAYDSVDVLNGVEYLMDIAKALDRPIAICLGLGTSDSAHDGLTYIERYLTLVAGIPKVSVITAAGNEGDAGHHAAGRLTGDEDMEEIEFNVTSNVTGLFMRMWAFPPDRLSISLLTPLGNIVDRRKFMTQERVSYSFVLETSQISIDYQYANPKNGSQTIIIRIFNPQPGIWRMRVYGDLIIDGRYNIWMPVSSLWSNSSYFLNPEVSITVTTPATAPALISVGAYNYVDGSIFISSSRGPNRVGDIIPDLVAPGVNVSGVFPGGIKGTMTGTSVSAAITAGACALMLQWAVVEGNYPTINNYTMISFLLIGLTQRRGIIYPDNLWGYGTLNLFDSFRNL